MTLMAILIFAMFKGNFWLAAGAVLALAELLVWHRVKP